jgi:hypothetical protein
VGSLCRISGIGNRCCNSRLRQALDNLAPMRSLRPPSSGGCEAVGGRAELFARRLVVRFDFSLATLHRRVRYVERLQRSGPHRAEARPQIASAPIAFSQLGRLTMGSQLFVHPLRTD